ncbi:MAG: ABC transporter permease [Comamonas sp.]|jgi:ABC-2 type transport system permease protein|nr:ABC transporter permease [Comamonas sp.]
MNGWQTLFYKELLRFWKVAFQTVVAPVVTSMLYLLIFGHVLENRLQVYGHLSYTAFLVPGLVMMSMLQNAFANSSSSLVQSKIMGNLVFIQLTPLSHWAWFTAYVGSSVVRGLVVGLGVFVVTLLYAQPGFVAPLWSLVFALLGAGLLAALGVIAGLWADKFDHMATFQNFIIVPMTFLSGVFYSIDTLPPFWQGVSQLNPFFYMVDGFRYGFFGVSDVSPWLSLAVVGLAWLLVSGLTLHLLRTGYKIRN